VFSALARVLPLYKKPSNGPDNRLQHNATQHNTTQNNKTQNKNCAPVLNKPVKVTLSSTKNSMEKNGQKTLQV